MFSPNVKIQHHSVATKGAPVTCQSSTTYRATGRGQAVVDFDFFFYYIKKQFPYL